ncbi:DUF4091 domain-containing protein, partial [bacterium]|nr:DUF4091 domain-containing protein [bacterium]
MAAAAVHFAIGMSAAAAVGGAVCLVRRRAFILLPLLMALCGLLALAPDLLEWAGGRASVAFLSRRAFTHAGWMNVFFLHAWLDGWPSLDTAGAAAAGFHVCVLLYAAYIAGYGAFVARRLPAMRESDDALRRMGMAVRSYRAISIVPALAPLLVTGVALSWVVLTAAPGAVREREMARRGEADWAAFVKRRVGVAPEPWLGLVRSVPVEGQWVVGELAARQAPAEGAGFSVLAGPVAGGPTDSPPLVGRWSQSEGGPSLLRLACDAAVAEPVVFVGDAASDTEFFSLLRGGAAGIVVRAESSRGAERVLGVGGAWDRLLARGFGPWMASASTGVRSHVWCQGDSPADVLSGLRSGCFWMEQGGIVGKVRFDVLADPVQRRVRMGEVVRVAPGGDVAVDLVLDVPEKDAAGRPNALDSVDLIANADGEAAVVQRWHAVQGRAVLRHVFEAVEDRNGAVGFAIRARGRKTLEDGTELAFLTNPIRVLVRDGPVRPSQDAPLRPRPAQPVAEPTHRDPKELKDTPKVEDDDRKRIALLEMAGVPTTVTPLVIAPHDEPAGPEWTGEWEEHVGDRGSALRDSKLRIAFTTRTEVKGRLRLSFWYRATECRRLTLNLRTSQSPKPYTRVWEAPNGRWLQYDVSLRDDFHNPLNYPGRLASPAQVLEIEWVGTRGGPRAALHLADVVVYQETPKSRLKLLRDRADAVENRRKVLAGLGVPSRKWAVRDEALTQRLVAFGDRTAPKAERYALREIEELDREIGALEEETRLLGLQATMARAFVMPDAPFALGVEAAARRVSSRNPALAFRGTIEPVYELWAAAGEAESFQIIVSALWKTLRAVDVTWSEFRPIGEGKGSLRASAIEASLPAEVFVYPREGLPTDRTGWTPDPLLPFLPFDVEAGGLRSVLLTVHVPVDLPPGDYEGAVQVRAEGEEPVELKVRLHRWDFSLADRHFPVLGRLDAELVRERDPEGEAPSPARLRQFTDLLLRHRLVPVPLLTGDEEADVAELTHILEQGAALAVVHHAASVGTGLAGGLQRGDVYAARLREQGWRRRATALLPLAPAAGPLREYTANVHNAVRRHPLLNFIAGGPGGPPSELTVTFWRRPLGARPPGLPRFDIVGTRRTRTIRREGWDLAPGVPDYPQPNLTLVNRLAESRSLAWLAWKHGVRALVLGDVNQWRENNTADGMLVYPGPGGDFLGSLRLVALRDAVEDYDLLWRVYDRWSRLRERAAEREDYPHKHVIDAALPVLQAVELGVGSFERPVSDPKVLHRLRLRLGTIAERLERAWWEEVDA